MLLVRNIRLNIKEIEDKDAIKRKVIKKLRINSSDLKGFRIVKESVDARKKPDIYITFTLLVEVNDEIRVIEKSIEDVSIYMEEVIEPVKRGNEELKERPLIVGFGPAGLFCALTLAEGGLNPIVIEMGEDVDKRTETVDDFWKSGKLNLKSNVQFGEGGAGTFSDGKLTTRIKDHRIDKVLDVFIEEGADEEIKYRSKPHVGTDVLKGIVKNIRKRIIKLGGEVRFNSRLEEIISENGKILGAFVEGERINCSVLVLCLGHSSRDTYSMLFNKGVKLESKSFALGFRVEHLQEKMDRAQYGDIVSSYLRASEYSLATRTSVGRGVYSFCMCPGGFVVNSSSEDGMLCINGMSYHARDGKNANSAIVTTVGPEDYGFHPLDGVAFQREMEKKAFILGGSNNYAPCQTVEDFLSKKKSSNINSVKPSVKPGFKLEELHNFYPYNLGDAIEEGMRIFGRRIKGFDKEGIFTGIETRTSAPLRIVRKDNYESISHGGLYPCGEGAGYAGGIMSAAVDGIKVAESILGKYSKLK